MRTRDAGLMHDGWTSLADILTTLVCGILFVGTVTWVVAQNGADKTAASLTRLDRLERQVGQLNTEIRTLVSGLAQARSLAARHSPTSALQRREGPTP